MRSLSRNQQKWLAGAGGWVLVSAALAWWGWGQLQEQQAQATILAEKMGNPGLAALLTDPDGLNRAGREAGEIQKLNQELRDADGTWTKAWTTATQQLAGEGQDWSKDPGKWKDRLIATESDLQKAAAADRVQLGPDFYLGLENYRQKSPAVEEVPELALHLSVAERLVRLFLEARRTPEQYPTACEFRSLTGPAAGKGSAPTSLPPGAASRRAAAPAGPKRITFQLEVRCSPEVLYEYVRLLTLNPALLILTDLSVTNEKEKFPLRSEIANRLSTEEAGVPNQPEPVKSRRLLEILAGKENLTALLQLDFVAWRTADESKGGEFSPQSR